jgi:hypothetical protein
MARPQVADGRDSLQIFRVTANLMNKQLWTANRRWLSSLGVGWEANNLHHKKISLL